MHRKRGAPNSPRIVADAKETACTRVISSPYRITESAEILSRLNPLPNPALLGFQSVEIQARAQEPQNNGRSLYRNRQSARCASSPASRREALAPADRLSPSLISQYVTVRRQSCSERTVASDLRKLRAALQLVCPTSNWSWLLEIAKRIEAQAPPKPERHHLVTSERLYALGMELMDPLRRRTLAALRIGKHVVKTGQVWALEIPAEDTKTRRPLDYPVSPELSERIDVYLSNFRCRISGTDTHDGLWASDQGRRMDHGSIYAAVRKRTRKAFGFAVNLHRFRHAAATLWSIRDPSNVRGARDLLGQASFQTTERHYILAQSRLAGRALARAIGRYE